MGQHDAAFRRIVAIQAKVDIQCRCRAMTARRGRWEYDSKGRAADVGLKNEGGKSRRRDIFLDWHVFGGLLKANSVQLFI